MEQVPHVAGQAVETPGTLHLWMVALFATHLQSLMIIFSFQLTWNLKIVSAQVLAPDGSRSNMKTRTDGSTIGRIKLLLFI